jgi:NAD(P)-dependent dehydrogenase (short-subunit alcohol dehydrogenase family)
MVVNNAAAPKGSEIADIHEVPIAECDRLLRVNAFGPFLTARAVAPHMRERRHGRIISVSSVAALAGIPKNAVYAASKGAILGMTRALAAELGPFGITVNAVCPGSIPTSRLVSNFRRAGADPAAGFAARIEKVPVGRLGEPRDIGAAVAFLASEAASFVNGQVLVVDGGEEMLL